MIEQFWKTFLRRKGLTAWSLLSPPLGLASVLYWPVSIWQRKRTHPAVRLPIPVVSVGNLSVGGSGKTPLVEFIARHLLSNEIKVGIVSSGFGRSGRSSFVASGAKLSHMPVEETGDEVMLLAQSLPDAIFSVDLIKSQAAAALAASGEVDIILVDDGFQHWSLERDIDIVTFDAAVPRRQLKLFPYGVLREPMAALKDAEIVIITRANVSKDLSAVRKRLRPFLSADTQLYSANFMMDELIGRNQKQPIKYLEDKSVFLFAGVGSFGSFRKQVKKLVGRISGLMELSDHQAYSPQRLQEIKAAAARSKADVIVTTAKDWVKLADFDFGKEIFYVSLWVDLDPGEEKLVRHLQTELKLVPRTGVR